MVRASVREWYGLGWGVLDSAETPGGCWTHYSAIVTPIISRTSGSIEAEYKTLLVGQRVELAWETPGQDGFDFSAASVRPVE